MTLDSISNKRMKKKEKISSLKVKVLLFDDILRKINNEKANIKSISNYFK